MITNNAASVYKSILQYVLDNAPPGLDEYRVRELQQKLEWEFSDLSSVYTEWRNDLTNVTLDVSFQTANKYKHIDVDGDLYSAYALRVQVNWPTHGSASPDVATKRLELYSTIVKFAKEIEEKFNGTYYSLELTKEQVAERDRLQEEKNIQAKLVEAFRDYVKGMRVTNQRSLPNKDIPVGNYQMSINDKVFQVVAGATALWATRTV